MEREKLGRTGLMVSPVTFGGIIVDGETQEKANEYVSFAIDNEVNYFDVAPSYGIAQERLGPALKPYRKEVFLACKTMRRDYEGAQEELLSSLKALKTDWFDVYQLHALSKMEDLEEAFGPGGVMEALLIAKRDGLIRNIGFSAHSEEVALKAIEMYDFDTVMFPMNWAMGINTGWGDRISEAVKETYKGFIGIKSLAKRRYLEDETKDFPKSWVKTIWDEERLGRLAMKYAIKKGVHTLIPPGDIDHFKFMLERIDDLIKYPLSDDDEEFLKIHAKKLEYYPIWPKKREGE